MYSFDPTKTKDEIVQWIRRWFEDNGNGCNAIVGISGGKDSSVVAALCVEALGKDRVVGVLMPNLAQPDIDYSFMLCEHLGITHFMVPITLAVTDVLNAVEGAGITPSDQASINLPARIRMATLYAVSQSMNGRVANTCNLSEDWVGYATRYGDSAGDFCPLANLTVAEVKAIGRACNIPEVLIEKTPSDGLCGKSDEDNLGFTYDELDQYIRTGEYRSRITKNRIDWLHRANRFKLKMPPSYDPGLQKIAWRECSEMNTDVQKRAAALVEDIENTCKKHGINMTAYDGGVGFVDQESSKIISAWRPALIFRMPQMSEEVHSCE